MTNEQPVIPKFVIRHSGSEFVNDSIVNRKLPVP